MLLLISILVLIANFIGAQRQQILELSQHRQTPIRRPAQLSPYQQWQHQGLLQLFPNQQILEQRPKQQQISDQRFIQLSPYQQLPDQRFIQLSPHQQIPDQRLIKLSPHQQIPDQRLIQLSPHQQIPAQRPIQLSALQEMQPQRPIQLSPRQQRLLQRLIRLVQSQRPQNVPFNFQQQKQSQMPITRPLIHSFHRPNPCHLKIEPGKLCKMPVKRYGYHYELGKCVPFFYKGCGVNSNSFTTPEECVQACYQQQEPHGFPRSPQVNVIPPPEVYVVPEPNKETRIENTLEDSMENTEDFESVEIYFWEIPSEEIYHIQ